MCSWRLSREALSNVARHAQASRARVELEVIDGALQLVVVDNGRGMPDQPVSGPDHLGIGNMRDRARALGGELRIERGPSPGARIIITVPLTRIRSRPEAVAAEEATPT